MTRVFTPVTALIAALLLTSQGADAFLLLKSGVDLMSNVASTGIGKAVDTFHRGEGVARHLIHEAGSLAGLVTGELAGGFLELVGVNDTCVGEAAEGCRKVVGELVQDYLDVDDVDLTPVGLWQALRKRILLHPGTKWCGAGNVARDYNDRGAFAATDACCRRHDNCPDNIAAGEESHGLRNDGSFTRSNCECDQEFYHCLKQANTLVSNKIGIIYFDILRPQCFERNFPAVYCKKESRSPIKHCAEYVLDRSQRPLWQWFDNPLY